MRDFASAVFRFYIRTGVLLDNRNKNSTLLKTKAEPLFRALPFVLINAFYLQHPYPHLSVAEDSALLLEGGYWNRHPALSFGFSPVFFGVADFSWIAKVNINPALPNVHLVGRTYHWGVGAGLLDFPV